MIWHSASVNEIITELQSDQKFGLTAGEAERRLQDHGPNQLTQKRKKTLVQRFIEQLKNFMVVILIIAALISLATTLITGSHDWFEPLIIIAIVILNAILGVVQEAKAEAALSALKNMAAPSAKVLRDGVTKIIRATELVPGDVILLEAGDYIPADGRVLTSSSLHCDESALTGESVPVEKFSDSEIVDIAPIADRSNMVYAGCSVTYGNGLAIVTETGMQSEMGKIAAMLETTDNAQTPLKQRMERLGKTLGLLALGICIVIFLIGLISGPAPGQTFAGKLLELLMTSISLAVAAIPEGLPAIVTIVLALGVQRMVKKNAIVRHLPAVETLGSASVICTDKTGTLTMNRMTLERVWDGEDIRALAEGIAQPHIQEILRLAALCCDGEVTERNGQDVHLGDPTETAILAAAKQYFHLSKEDIVHIYPRLAEIPFDSDRKLMTTVNMIDGVPYAITKGAPEILLPLCTQGKLDNALKAADTMASDALRVLAVAYKRLDAAPAIALSDDLECDLTFLGLIGMMDPPRPEAKAAVELCKKAGIRTIMITGDHLTTAQAIGKRLGILLEGTKAVTGSQLQGISDEELERTIADYSVFARVSPQDKLRIVRAWQKQGRIVSMTGDGVNDAPALKKADIGCAMGSGTDVARGAADLVLTDDNFATIVSAVKEGRGIYDNIKKATHFLLSCNLGEILTVFAGVLIWGRSPLLAVHLLWINLVTDGMPALSLGVEKAGDDIMERPPREKNESILRHGIGVHAVWQGALFAIITLLAYYLGLRVFPNGSVGLADTMAFAVLAFSQIIHANNVRSAHSLFRIGFHTNLYMLLANGASIVLMCLLLLTPVRELFSLSTLSGGAWGVVILLSFVPLAACELQKLVARLIKRYRTKTSS